MVLHSPSLRTIVNVSGLQMSAQQHS